MAADPALLEYPSVAEESLDTITSEGSPATRSEPLNAKRALSIAARVLFSCGSF
jgi:hypothetical protein